MNTAAPLTRLASAGLVVLVAPAYGLAALAARVSERRHALSRVTLRALVAERRAVVAEQGRAAAEEALDARDEEYAAALGAVRDDVRMVYGPAMVALLDESWSQAVERHVGGGPR